jgi:putative LysE/RhtB family amino acid efflux pump
MEWALKGLLLGLGVAMPVGPIGLLCIQRTLAQGFTAGLAGGLGTAAADAAYAILGAAGLAAMATQLGDAALVLRYAGCAFMAWLGWQAFRQPPADKAASLPDSRDLLRSFAATFALTLANPATIISFVALFAGLGLAEAGNHEDAILLVGGVFLGSLAWWLILCGGVSALRHRVTPLWLGRVNRVAGLGIIALALWLAL